MREKDEYIPPNDTDSDQRLTDGKKKALDILADLMANVPQKNRQYELELNRLITGAHSSMELQRYIDKMDQDRNKCLEFKEQQQGMAGRKKTLLSRAFNLHGAGSLTEPEWKGFVDQCKTDAHLDRLEEVIKYGELWKKAVYEENSTDTASILNQRFFQELRSFFNALKQARPHVIPVSHIQNLRDNFTRLSPSLSYAYQIH